VASLKAFSRPLGYKFPWAKVVMGEGRIMHHVQCKICTNVEWREKLLIPKLDGFDKHSGRTKCKHAKPKLKVGEYYTSPHSQHEKNEHIYGITGLDSILEQVLNSKRAKKRKNTSSLFLFSIFYNKENP
jgi:hypothetical protein